MVQYVTPKKSLGQHFLTDPNIARKISQSLTLQGDYQYVLEVGPGTGMLSQFLISNKPYKWFGMDVDKEAVDWFIAKYPDLRDQMIAGDFLRHDLHSVFADTPFAVIGNFPYNISSQIMFRVLEYRSQIPEVVGMFQKEVAMRIASPPGNKTYGILSVLMQAFYDVSVLFHVEPHVFHPPPKVQSAVLRLVRKGDHLLCCDEPVFFSIVKTAFNQRRKMLRNSLKGLPVQWDMLPGNYITERPERLSVADFAAIAGATGRNDEK